MESRFLKSSVYYFVGLAILFLTINDKNTLIAAIAILTVAWFAFDRFLINKARAKQERRKRKRGQGKGVSTHK